jgi:hypothetical protein
MVFILVMFVRDHRKCGSFNCVKIEKTKPLRFRTILVFCAPRLQAGELEDVDSPRILFITAEKM